MDLEELMQFAPKDCQPTVITNNSILEEWAKAHNKSVEEMTDEEKEQAKMQYQWCCMTDYDMLTS